MAEVNHNERELERAGYDNWKLSNRDDEMGYVDNEEETPEEIGKCKCCTYEILDNMLFVEDEEEDLYHFSCYNYMIKEKREKENGE